jgi:hypothetical protein
MGDSWEEPADDSDRDLGRLTMLNRAETVETVETVETCSLQP